MGRAKLEQDGESGGLAPAAAASTAFDDDSDFDYEGWGEPAAEQAFESGGLAPAAAASTASSAPAAGASGSGVYQGLGVGRREALAEAGAADSKGGGLAPVVDSTDASSLPPQESPQEAGMRVVEACAASIPAGRMGVLTAAEMRERAQELNWKRAWGKEDTGVAAAPVELTLDALRRWACCGNVYGKHTVACNNCGTAAPPEGERRALPKPTVRWAEKGEMLEFDPGEAPAKVAPKKRPKSAQGNLPP